MRQRLGIATALIGDPGGSRWMRDLLRDFADQGGTVLLSSHLTHEIEVIADDLVVIGNGRIVAQGSKQDLLSTPRTRAAARSTPPPTPTTSAGSPSRPASP